MVFEAWPADALEAVPQCPYCGGADRMLAHEGVQDWAFGCAPGLWNYWLCKQCRALYLSPRPDSGSIGNAYARYFTHAVESRSDLKGALRQRLRNEYWSNELQTNMVPRLGLPRWAGWLTHPLKPWITEQFGLQQWAQLPKGLLIDVGCGNGEKLKLAAQLGWQTVGIELDASAVKAARAHGLNVIQGGYEVLADNALKADCLVCSHVLEHVHKPLHLLQMLLGSLKDNGTLLLSAPNASSYLRMHYGENWRGLEAPRHLAIPDATWLMSWIRAQGFECRQIYTFDSTTAVESERIKRRGRSTTSADTKLGNAVLRTKRPELGQQDIIQLVCSKAKYEQS